MKPRARGKGKYEEVRLNNDQLLHEAMQGRTDDLAKLLKKEDVNPNVCDGRHKISALHFMACAGNLEEVKSQS